MKLKVGTRGSALALAQAGSLARNLETLGASVDLVTIKTSGDHLAQMTLAEVGGKALFVKEIEEALLDGRVDVGVHSLKDMPAMLPDGLCLGAFPEREDPSDVLLSRSGGALAELPQGAVVATSSLRRRVLLLAQRPDLRIAPIRGNVETRLRKLEDGLYDALVLARAGLNRLGLAPGNAWSLPPEDFLPAVGQGILAVEVRQADREVLELLKGVDHTETRTQAEAERSFLCHLSADCHTPVAGWARLRGDGVTLSGLVASLDGAVVLSGSVSGPAALAENLGRKLAEELLSRGARAILDSSREEKV